MATAQERYAALREILAYRAKDSAAKAVCEWDHWTRIPEGARDYRAEILAHFDDREYEGNVEPEYVALVDELAAAVRDGTFAPDSDERHVIESAWADSAWDRLLPEKFVRERNELFAGSYAVWDDAHKAKRWANFLPTFTKIVDCQRREIEMIQEKWVDLVPEPPVENPSPYDWLLDQYDSGLTAHKAELLFSQIVPTLSALVRQIGASGVSFTPPEGLGWSLSVREQEDLCRRIAVCQGFDFSRGALDRTTHPFSTHIHPGYTGIATRYFEKDPLWAIYGVIHEVGHGMLAQSSDPEYFGTVLSGNQSFGFDESQSRTWERLVGAGPEFCEWLVRTCTDLGYAPPSAEVVYRALNCVRPSYIRFEADEVTYNLHVAIRCRAERMLMERTIEPADFFDAWRVMLRDYLGLEITCDSQGPLQDSHYSGGLGGFLCYSLGNVWNAHLFEAAQRDIPGLVEGFREGRFVPLAEWQRQKLYRHCARLKPEALITRATGLAPTADAFLRHIDRRYRPLYGL